jgi:hypothetical protein
VNVEFSNEALAKAKSWELRSYRKALRNASKKTHHLEPGRLQVDRLLRKMPVRLGPMAGIVAEGANIRGKAVPQVRDQRVEDNAFHQLELSGLFRFR